MSLADVCVSASRREGLPINIVEAMAVGLPIVATNCRGNSELVTNDKNGFLVGIDDAQGFAAAVEKIYSDENRRKLFALENKKRVVRYSLPSVLGEITSIYREYAAGDKMGA
jgi:glycosyltransferase EpsD